jgi:hypothetical protein
VSRLPSGGTTKPGIIGVIKPNKTAVNMVKRYIDQNTSSTVESIFSYAKPSIIVLSVLSSQPVDLADMANRISNNTFWDVDLGVALSVNSAFPGIVFSPIASRFIAGQGFPEVKVGDLTAYKYSAEIGNGKSISIYLNVSGNHIFATASGKDFYAQTLMTKFSR